MLGNYLVIKIGGEVIAEANKVNLKLVAKPLKATTKSNGIASAAVAGKVMIGISGSFMYASDGDNFDRLYDYLSTGGELGVGLYRNGELFLNGYGVMKKLSKRGANSDQLVTGAYGIRYNYSSDDPGAQAILTESGLNITTESGQQIIIE
jgi:hypothetical protein